MVHRIAAIVLLSSPTPLAHKKNLFPPPDILHTKIFHDFSLGRTGGLSALRPSRQHRARRVCCKEGAACAVNKTQALRKQKNATYHPYHASPILARLHHCAERPGAARKGKAGRQAQQPPCPWGSTAVGLFGNAKSHDRHDWPDAPWPAFGVAALAVLQVSPGSAVATGLARRQRASEHQATC